MTRHQGGAKRTQKCRKMETSKISPSHSIYDLRQFCNFLVSWILPSQIQGGLSPLSKGVPVVIKGVPVVIKGVPVVVSISAPLSVPGGFGSKFSGSPVPEGSLITY